MAKKPVYVMVDVEASGHNMAQHSLLSWAACVVVEEPLTKEELKKRGFVYYDELEPQSYDWLAPTDEYVVSPDGYVTEAMRVGCLGLRCLEKFKGNPAYDPMSPIFSPASVLEELARNGTRLDLAVYRFKKWLNKVAGRGGFVILGSDTSLFDLPWIKYYFDTFGAGKDALGHSGFNLKSFLMGMKKQRRVKKSSIAKDDRVVAHCAEDDAIYLAKLARIVLYESGILRKETKTEQGSVGGGLYELVSDGILPTR